MIYSLKILLKDRVQFVYNKINKGQERSVKAKKNILGSLLLKGTSIVISIVLLPLTINYINVSQYGIWLTLSSIVGWFAFFDIGLTQGLRNKFAEAIAKGNDSLAQAYVSTTYAILAIIFFFLWLCFLIVNRFLNWPHILNISQNMQSEISILAVIIFTYFCLQFVLGIITTIITADQQPAKASLISVLGQILSLIIIIILVKTTHGSLIKLGIALCLSPLVILLAANIFLFKGIYHKYRPLISKVKFSYAKGLFNLGVVFFIIQIAAIIQYQTANIIIAQNFSTADVTSYNIVYKYFGMLQMIFNIFLAPFWSATTEAYFKNDIQWIKNGIKKYNYLNIILFVVAILMLIFSSNIYNLWLGKGKVNINFLLSFWGFVYFNIYIFGSKYVFFLNGISALRIQFCASLVTPIIYILLSIFLIKYYKLGVYSLFIAAVIANFNALIIAPLQYHMVINKKKKGIWIK
jgi:O-antigen/teichoic acid export membrane protein